MLHRDNPFSRGKDEFSPLMVREQFLMGMFATTAIAGMFTPVLFAPNLNNPTKLIMQLFGYFSGACFTAEAYRRKHKDKFYTSIEQANHAIVNAQLKGLFTFEQQKTAIETRRDLANYVKRLPEIEQPIWVESLGLHGLVELPQIQQAVIEQPRQLRGSRTIPNPEIATIDENEVQSIINPSTRQLLEDLATEYPEYIRIDDLWVDELCESSANQNMSDRANHHFGLWGETQSGKSTLAGIIINKIAAKSQGAAHVIGSDPKVFVTRWLCKFSKKFNGWETLSDWVTFATRVIKERQKEFEYNPKGGGISEIFLVQDEVNAAYGAGEGMQGVVPKKVAISLCGLWNYIISITAAMKIHGIFMGQNPLSTFTGFSRPQYKNVCFIALGKVSSYILSKPSDFLNVKNEIIDLLKEVCELLDKEEARYALVIPTRGNPFIGLIPIFDIDAMEQREPEKTEVKQDTANYYEILVEWIKKSDSFPTPEKLKLAWKQLTEQELNDIGVKLLTAKLKEELGDE